MPKGRRWRWLALAGVVCASCGTDVGFLVPPGDRDAVVAAFGQQFNSFHDFSDSDGNAPQARLLASPDGSLYGTTTGSSDSDRGTIFRVDRSQNLAVLHDFNDVAGFGDRPTYAPLSLAFLPDGSLVGVTQAGGNRAGGSLFQLQRDGDFDVLHHFAGRDGANPIEAIVADDGTIYGVTEVGGPEGGRGTLFAYEGDRAIVLHSFRESDGINPTGLVQGKDGYLYGTTRAGGQFGRGTIFQFDAAAGLTVLHSFSDSDGAVPVAGLTVAEDGSLYGTTARGGQNDSGVIFRLVPGSAVQILHEFNGSDGSAPAASVTQASDGYLYGTTEFGGRGNSGTIYRLAPDGTFASIYAFSSRDGAFPRAELTETRDRWLYGTTSSGGASGRGTIFRLPLPEATDRNLSTPLPEASPTPGPIDVPQAELVAPVDDAIAQPIEAAEPNAPDLARLARREPDLTSEREAESIAPANIAPDSAESELEFVPEAIASDEPREDATGAPLETDAVEIAVTNENEVEAEPQN